MSRGRKYTRGAAHSGAKGRRARRTPPWYHRISSLTWILLCLLLAASASLALRTSRQARAAATSTQVQVLNGSGVPDLARQVADQLRDRGLDVVSVGNADASEYGETLVLLRRGHPSVAVMVARRLGMGIPLQQLDPTLLVDVTVILGQDWSASSPSAPAARGG